MALWDLRRLQLQQQQRAVNRTVVRAGAVTTTASLAGVAEEKLHVEVSGTAYPVFILGLHDPDDSEVARWVP